MKYDIGTILFRVTGFEPMWDSAPSPYVERSLVIKHTPKGMWLKRPYHDKLKFQLNNGGRYAALTIEEAMEAFRFRRIRYLSILDNNIAHAQQELQQAKDWKPSDAPIMLGELPVSS